MMDISHVEVRRATKVFGTVCALRDVSFEICQGEVLAVMGANGAGKSTLLSLLSLRMKATRGVLLFNREAVSRSSVDLVSRIGLLSHDAMVYPELTAMENLLLFARLYELKDAKSAADNAASRIGLQGFGRDRPVRVLSRGQLQRVALARAIIAKPQFLLLDEPATGLDGEAVGRIDAIVKELREQGGMAVLVTHEPEVASRMASRALMLSRGRVVADVPAPEDSTAWKQLYMKTVGT